MQSAGPAIERENRSCCVLMRRPLNSTKDGRYHLRKEGRTLTGAENGSISMRTWRRAFRSARFEDGVAEDDWETWGQLTGRLGDRVQLVGDDLFVTTSSGSETGLNKGPAIRFSSS